MHMACLLVTRSRVPMLEVVSYRASVPRIYSDVELQLLRKLKTAFEAIDTVTKNTKDTILVSS